MFPRNCHARVLLAGIPKTMPYTLSLKLGPYGLNGTRGVKK